MNSELRVNEAESFNEASEVRTDYDMTSMVYDKIFIIPFNID